MSVWIALLGFLFLARVLLGRQDTKRRQAQYLAATGAAVAAVMGFRYPHYDVVSDLSTYVRFYERMIWTPWNSIFDIGEFEWGYVLANKLLSTVVPWGQFIVIAEAAFCVYCVARFIYKNSEYAFQGMLFYVTIGAMSFQLTGFRQGIAMSICLLAIEHVKARRPVAFVLVVLLAATFHQTALVFLPAYFLISRRPTFTKSVLWLMMMVAGVLSATAIAGIGNRLFDREYVGYIGSTYGGLVPILIYAGVVLVSLWRRGKLSSPVGLNMTMLGLAIYVMRYATLVLERIAFYFTQGVVISLPEAINAEADARLKTVLRLGAISGALALFIYRVSVSEWGVYRFFWQW